MNPDAHYFEALMDAQPPDIEIGGRLFQRLPWGHGLARPVPECGCCGVPIGRLHVQPCTWETCPACSGPILDCGCLMAPPCIN